MITTKMIVLGFHCDSCMKLTQAMLEDVPGVKEVRVKNMHGDTEIDADRRIDIKEAEEVLGGTGYSVMPGI